MPDWVPPPARAPAPPGVQEAAGSLARADRPATRLATRLSFLAAGFGMACWAPLVPYVKARLGADDAAMGLLLLCLGIGSILAMPLAGAATGRVGSRPVILLGGLGLCLTLPVLAAGTGFPILAGALLLFGSSLGAIDVAMNVHAVEVERDADVPLMSGFHGLFSVGGFVGAGGMAALLGYGFAPLTAALAGVAAVLTTLAFAAPRLLRTASGGSSAFFVAPRGIVLLLGALASATFLAEGAVLDWSAVFLAERRGFSAAEAGVGYAVFSLAMTGGRLTGDAIVARLGGRRVLLWGGLLAVAGFAALLLAPSSPLALSGLFLVGLGASNLVPVLFSAAGRQTAMPRELAVASITTLGYAGILAGPALIGFVAQAVSLDWAFALVAALVLCVPLASRAVTR